ncbi:hypothetical protein DYQ86_16255 [Acidobacteria bacterium AB60]|nr:hypothetical protein DYQ86_16255 [Acidobacteria bacterium AB60]
MTYVEAMPQPPSPLNGEQVWGRTQTQPDALTPFEELIIRAAKSIDPAKFAGSEADRLQLLHIAAAVVVMCQDFFRN